MEELKIKSLEENQKDYDKDHAEYNLGQLIKIIYNGPNDRQTTIGLLIEDGNESPFFKYGYKYEEVLPFRQYTLGSGFYEVLCVMVQKDGSYKLRYPIYRKSDYFGDGTSNGPIEKVVSVEDYIDSLGKLCSDEGIYSKAKKAALENYDKNSNIFVVVRDYAKNIFKQKGYIKLIDKLDQLETSIQSLKKELEVLEKPLNFQNFKKQCLETYVEKYKNKYSDAKYAKILKLFDEKSQEHTIDEIKELHKYDMENPRYRKENPINDDKELDEIVKYAYYLPLEKCIDFSSFYEKRKKDEKIEDKKTKIEDIKKLIKSKEDAKNKIDEELNNIDHDHKTILDIMKDLIKN